jgi:AraC-like DNA-binding protein
MLEQTRPTGHGRAKGLVSDRASGSRIEVQTFRPSKELSTLVHSYWTSRWDLQGQVPHRMRMLTDPCMHVVFERGQSRLVGVWTKTWERIVEGKSGIRAAKLQAGACRAWLTEPASHYADRMTPLAKVLGASAQSLEQRVLDPRDAEAGFAELEAWLAAHRTSDAADTSLARALCDQIMSSQEGQILRVSQLCERTGLGLRELQRVFRECVGASPKWMIRRCRLQEAALRIESGTEGPSFAALASELGYADQAHLARDFRSAVGASPSEFKRRMRS